MAMRKSTGHDGGGVGGVAKTLYQPDGMKMGSAHDGSGGLSSRSVDDAMGKQRGAPPGVPVPGGRTPM